MHTWTYSPQKRHSWSAFALRYILRLRSCRLVDAFVISSLPSLLSEKRQQQGAFAPRALPRLNATTRPSATLSPSAPFPMLPVIGPTLLRRFRAGARRASPVAWSVLVIVPPLPPRRSGPAVSIRFRPSMLPSPYGCGLGLRNTLSRPPTRSLALRPDDSQSPQGRPCR